jgi:hypothetical protein
MKCETSKKPKHKSGMGEGEIASEENGVLWKR